MATKSPSTLLRQQLREKILERVGHLQLTNAEAAETLGLTLAQMSRLAGDQDIFTLDRLVDAASHLGLEVRMNITRPYQRE